jgi:hypothetical protein
VKNKIQGGGNMAGKNSDEEVKAPYFDAPDDKILAFDMFRGPSIGILSNFDLENPGRKQNEDQQFDKNI